MELFGAKFSIALGAWRLRFVLMLEDDDERIQAPAASRPPHHVALVRDPSRVR